MKKFKLHVLLLGFLFGLSLLLILNIEQDNRKELTGKNESSRRYSSQSFTKKIKTTDENIRSTSVWSEKKKRVKGVLKTDQPDMYAKIKSMLRIRDGETKHGYSKNYRFTEYYKAKERARSLNKTAATTMDVLPWVERGPANVGGRTRGIIIDPDDPALGTWYGGSVGGGIWKTTNSGQTWMALTDDLPNLAVAWLEMAPSNHDIIYAGTGEGFFNADAIEGDGIFKSTDRGETWTQLASTASNSDFSYVNRLVVDPDNENIVVAATNNGLQKTTDGGQTWSKNYSGGRVQDLVANPENFNILYATENALGVVKSFDAGDTWIPQFGGKVGGGRLEIAISFTDTSRLYISADGNPSTLFATTNSGNVWEKVEELDGSNINWLGAQGWYDNTIAVHPYDENVVYMGGIDVWKSDIIQDSMVVITNLIEEGIDTLFAYAPKDLELKDGGLGTGNVFWNEIVAVSNDYVNAEIRFGPGKSQKAHRYINNYVYQDYVDVPFEAWDVDNNRQLMLSFHDLQRNGVYNLLSSRGDVIHVNSIEYDPDNPSPNMTTDNGAKFKNIFVVAFKNAPGRSWSPDLPDALLGFEIGKIPILKKSTVPVTDGYGGNGGGARNVHVDHHNLVMVPINEATNEFLLLNGNDGGIAISYDGGTTFTEVGDNGYNTTQFYGIDKMPGGSHYTGGTQDNGTFMSTYGDIASDTSSYIHVLGGDGFETAWHHNDPMKLMGGSQYNGIYRTVDGWASREAANVGFPDWRNSGTSPFISKIAESNSDPDLVFVISRNGVYRSDNFAESWELTPITEDFQSGGYFSFAQVAISIADPQVVWAGAYMGTDGKMQVSKDGGLSFTAANNYGGGNMGRVTGFDTHPTDPATAYATFSFADAPKILKTTNYGDTWEDISGFSIGSSESSRGFPNIAVYCVAVMPFDENIIWAGTDFGIVESVDGGASWSLVDNGLPAVAIWEIKIVDDEVVLATHGRGIWSVSLPELADYEPPAVTLSPRLNAAFQNPSGVILDVGLRSAYDSTLVVIDGAVAWKVFNEQPVDTTLIVPVMEAGEITVELNSYKDGRAYKSPSKNIQVFELQETVSGYANDFDSDSDELFLDGFSVQEAIGFSSAAIHTPHPYTDQKERLMMLLVPIEVAASNAILSYDDVAIIEPGEPGTVFGDSQFWDYVIVEASKGGDWIHLEPGYDARYNSNWLNAYQSGQNGSSSMFVNHSINLLNTFSAGDTIMVRFRLFADQFTVGWGWAIDNLVIQGQFVDVQDDINAPRAYDISQNYPNPFNPSTTIAYSLPFSSSVKIRIFDALGQEVKTLVNAVKSAGYYQESWNAAGLASGIYFYNIEAKAVDGANEFRSTKKMILLK